MADLEVPEEVHPAYPISSNTRNGPQCSQHKDDFCFFCEYASSGPDVGSDIDLRGSLTALINLLHRENRELAHIVESVHDRYTNSVRPHVPDQPHWSRDSIKRHLLYSTEFSELFVGVVTQVFQTIICSLNDTMMDDDNRVIEHTRRAFVDTITAYTKWRKVEGQPSKN